MRFVRVPFRVIALAFSLLVAPAALRAETEPQGIVLDRVLAIVSGEVVLESDVDVVIGLRLVEPGEDEALRDFRRRVLDALVDERLRRKDLSRFGELDVPADRVEDEIEQAAAKFGGKSAFLAEGLRHGLDREALLAFFRQRVELRFAAEERFGGTVFVSDEDVAEFLDCEPELRERMAAEGIDGRVKLAPEIAAEVRRLLARRRIGDQIDRWLSRLRSEARIEYRDGRPALTSPRAP